MEHRGLPELRETLEFKDAKASGICELRNQTIKERIENQFQKSLGEGGSS